MDNRERNWYEGEHEHHPPTCSCYMCCEAKRRRIEEEAELAKGQARMRQGATGRIAEIKRRHELGGTMGKQRHKKHWKGHKMIKARSKKSPLRTILTIIAVITTCLAAIGVFFYISPTLFIGFMSHMPYAIQEATFMDFCIRGGMGFWIFAVVSGILWYFLSKRRRRHKVL